MKKRLLLSIFAFLGISILTACSGGQDKGAEQSTSTAKTEQATTEHSKITVYSNSLTPDRDAWLKEHAKQAGFDIETLGISGGELFDRMVSEKDNPVADVMFGLNEIYLIQLKEKGIIEPSSPSWKDKVDSKAADKDGYYWPIVMEPVMLVYDDAAYPDGKGAPADCEDLWRTTKFKNQYEVPNQLGGATSQLILASIASRYRDDKGKEGVSEEGWKAIETFYKNGIPSIQGTDLYARMKNKEVHMGQINIAAKMAREKQYGLKTTPIPSKLGTPVVHQFTAIIKGTKHKEEAQKFMDWFGSAEVQGAWSKQFGVAPANVDAQKLGNKEVIDFTNSFKAFDFDWEFVAKHLSKWVEITTLGYLN